MNPARVLCQILIAAFCFSNAAPAQTPVKTLPKKGKLNLLVHPSDMLVCEGMPVVFRAFAACPAPDVPKYQWQWSADGLNWDDVPNATTAVYDGIGLARRPHNGSQFRVKVTDGRETITSFPAQLLVESGLYFTQKPEKQSVAEGSSVKFEARAETESGNGVASYQWQMSPYASGVWLPLRGENQPVLNLGNVDANMNGNSYRLLARTFNNCDSAVSAPAFLAVSGKPVVSITPLNRSLCGGGEAVFTVQLQGGHGRENCQWQVSKNSKGEFEDLPGEKTLTLRLGKITTDMDGWKYRAVIKLMDGSQVATQAASITVHGNVAFSKQPVSMSVCMGEMASFSVDASFLGKTPDFQWQMSTDGGNSWQNLLGARSAKFEIPFATPDLAGQKYRAVAESGECGSVNSNPAQLIVFQNVAFSEHPRDTRAETPGGPVVFGCIFEKQSGAAYSINWEWSGNDGSTWQFMPGGKENVLTIPKTSPEMRDNLYRMKVLDKTCGRISYSNPARILD